MCSETRSSTFIQTSSAERCSTGYFTQELTIASTRSRPKGVITRFPDSVLETSPCSSRTDRSRYAVLTLISNLSATVEGPTSQDSSTVIKTFCCLSEMFIQCSGTSKLARSCLSAASCSATSCNSRAELRASNCAAPTPTANLLSLEGCK